MADERDTAAALLDRILPLPAAFTSQPDAGRRFAVHRNNVVSSLIDVLAETFPVCRWPA